MSAGAARSAVGGPAGAAIPRRPGGAREVAYWLGRRLLLPVARAHRRRLRDTLVVAITGSAGKTTTKNLVRAVLAETGPGTASPGSRNRAKGLVQVLARTRRHHRFSVHEVAACGPGTLDELLWTLEPEVGVVTTVGREHYTAFRGLDAVAREKAKVVQALPPDGLAVLDADQPLVRAMAGETAARVLLVGRSPDADLRAEAVRAGWPEPLAFEARWDGQRVAVATRLFGEHWLPAVLSALAVGVGAAGLTLAEAAAALARSEPERHRLSEARLPGGVTFLEDDWKAPTWSLDSAFEVLRTARARRRILVLGRLSDDPKNARQLYRRVVRRALEAADVVVAVGRSSDYLEARADGRLHAFATAAECHRFLAGFLAAGDLVLVKSGAGHEHLERLVLARQEGMACWRHACGRRLWCHDCRLRWSAEPAPRAPGGLPR
ncbi:MAG TPA: Mur ligase family protein [Thermoanaerobaculia bacterium]